MPVMDLTLGFHQVAKFYYFPGWHQQATINELIISKKKWAEFSDTQKAIIQAACDATMLQQFAEGEAVQFKAMKEIAGQGRAAQEVAAELPRCLREGLGRGGRRAGGQEPGVQEGLGQLQQPFARTTRSGRTWVTLK